jgi:hypothetical protein
MGTRRLPVSTGSSGPAGPGRLPTGGGTRPVGRDRKTLRVARGEGRRCARGVRRAEGSAAAGHRPERSHPVRSGQQRCSGVVSNQEVVMGGVCDLLVVAVNGAGRRLHRKEAAQCRNVDPCQGRHDPLLVRHGGRTTLTARDSSSDRPPFAGRRQPLTGRSQQAGHPSIGMASPWGSSRETWLLKPFERIRDLS